MPDFNKELIVYVEGVQEVVNKYYAQHYTNLVPCLIQVEGGRKYVKISSTNDGGAGSKSVHSFINTENGDVLKPASWKTPAKHARGNIFSPKNGLEAIGPSGHVHYMR